MNPDLCLKRMGVWRRDGGRRTREKELEGRDQGGRRDRKKGVKGRMWDLEGTRPLGVWGRQEEDACCSAK